MEFIEVEVSIKKKVPIQEPKSSLIQRIENNVNNGTTPQSLIQRVENNVNNPNQNNKYPNSTWHANNHTPQQQIVGTVKNMKPVRQLQVIYVSNTCHIVELTWIFFTTQFSDKVLLDT